ncbi:MAG: hypothetical protein FJZ58_03080 [Chlamydiae bacterium]|nr:hypothetical protein [Chlamydiota bacterium]
MKYISLFILLIVLILFGLVYYQGVETWSDKSERVSNEVTKVLAKKLYDKYDLIIVGTGGGITDTIRNLFLGFQFHQPTTAEEARELIVNVTNVCLQEINSHPEWLSYFTEYPVTVNNIELSIYIHRADYSDFALGAVRYVLMNEGKWCYRVVCPEGAPYDITSKTSPKETYEEAMTILYAQGEGPITQ